MLLTDAARSEAYPGSDEVSGDSSPMVALSAGLKALFAAASGLVLACGFGVLIWAITPSSGDGPLGLVRAAVSTFAAANGMTIVIGRASLTLPPLMLTLVAIALLTAVSGRGRLVARDRTQEVVSVLAASAVYSLVVTGVAVGLGSRGAVRADQWWRPALLAVVVIGCTVLVRGEGWRPYLLDRLPGWVPVSVRLGVVTVFAVLGGGAVTIAIGLVRSVSDASTVQTLAAPGAAGGFGLAMLGLAYLPNAVVAGAGYATGVGFTIGDGSYSPFGSNPVELPAVSLLTAAPHGHALVRPAFLLLLFPLLAALLVGRAAVRRLDQRVDRIFAVAGAALLAGFVLAMIAAAASGGVSGGEWSSSGVPPVLFGAVVALGGGAIGGAVAGVARVLPVEQAVDEDVADAVEVVENDAEPEADAAEVAEADDAGIPEVAAVEAMVDVTAETNTECGQPDEQADDDLLADAPEPDRPEDAEAAEVAEVPEAADAAEVSEDAASAEVKQVAEAAEVAEVAEISDELESADEEIEVEETAGAGDLGAETSEDSMGETTTELEGAAVTPAIPSPREEDVIAGELAEGNDPDAVIASGLSRLSKPSRVG